MAVQYRIASGGMTLTDWVVAAETRLARDGSFSSTTYPSRSFLRKVLEADSLDWLEEAVNGAPNQYVAVREAQAWLRTVAHHQRGGLARYSSNLVQARHILALAGCCPRSELEKAFPSIWRELLGLIRPGVPDDARAVGLAATGEALRRLLDGTEVWEASVARAARGGSKCEVGAEAQGRGGGRQPAQAHPSLKKSIAEMLCSRIKAKIVPARSPFIEESKFPHRTYEGAKKVVVGHLPKLVPVVTACVEGTAMEAQATGGSRPASPPPPSPSVTSCALGVLELLASNLKSTLRPHLRRIQAVSVPWLQGPHDVVRDRAAGALASLALCEEAEGWTQAVLKVTLEAHSVLEAAWPDGEVDMGPGLGSPQLEKALRDAGGRLLQPLVDSDGKGEQMPQQTLSALVSRRIKGLCRVLELMLTGDSNGKAVVLPVPLIIALVERVQRISSVVQVPGPEAYIPVAQGALSPGALRAIRPSLELEAIRLLGALASAMPAMVLRRSRRMCRALVHGATRPSSLPWLRAAAYRAVERATLQLGACSTRYLAVPVLPSLLAEVRSLIASPESSGSSSSGFQESSGGFDGKSSNGAAAGLGSGGGMRVEPAVSTRKSSHKKQKRLREKELGRALAAANSASSSEVPPGLTPGHGAVRACGDSVMEAGCAALSCLTQVVLCCKGYLPLAARLGVEGVLHEGLGLLKRLDLGGLGGSARGRGARTAARSSSGMEFENLLPLGDRRAMRGFVLLAHACLVTPLGDGTRSGVLPIALGVFRSLRLHPDGELAAASETALAGCGALLYPRAAPLHLPAAITTQAKAWGFGDGEGPTGLPLGWGKVLATGEALSDDMGDEGHEDVEGVEGEGEMGRSEPQPESPRKKVKTVPSLLLSSPDVGGKRSRTATVVTPSSEMVNDALSRSVEASGVFTSAEAARDGERDGMGRRQAGFKAAAATAASPGGVDGAAEFQGVAARNGEGESGSGTGTGAVAGSPEIEHAEGSEGRPENEDTSPVAEDSHRGHGEMSGISAIEVAVVEATSEQALDEAGESVDCPGGSPAAKGEKRASPEHPPRLGSLDDVEVQSSGRGIEGFGERGSVSDEGREEQSDDEFEFPSIVDADPDDD